MNEKICTWNMFEAKHWCGSCPCDEDEAICKHCGKRGYEHPGYENEWTQIDRLEKENVELKERYDNLRKTTDLLKTQVLELLDKIQLQERKDNRK